MDRFLDEISRHIEENRLLPAGSPVVAGVSGGADSLALLHVLHALSKPYSLRLTVAHLNHGLRGPSADADAAFVADCCRRLGIDCVIRRVDVRALSAVSGRSLEEAGRQARQAFFNDLADKMDSGRADGPRTLIALAHHQDDQAETLLLHLGRGSGLDGLTGMKPSSGRVIRPLLGQSRRTIEAWLTSRQIIWREDESNQDLFAMRNRLRLKVLPAWADALGYDPAPLLTRTAASLEEDRHVLDRLARAAFAQCQSGGGLLAAVVAGLEPAIQSRVLRLFWAAKTGGFQDFSYTHVSLIRAWLPAAKPGKSLSLPGRQRLVLKGELLVLDAAGADATASLKAEQPVRLRLPGKTDLFENKLQIHADFVENAWEIVYNDTTEYFHLDRIDGCVVRHRLPGDQIHPYGRIGGKTLKKFLNEQGVPPAERDRLPVVALDGEVVWIPGLTAGAAFVTRDGRDPAGRVIRLSLVAPDSDAT